MQTITFGKYKGLSRQGLLDLHPRYALWAHKHVSFFSLSPEEAQPYLDSDYLEVKSQGSTLYLLNGSPHVIWARIKTE